MGPNALKKGCLQSERPWIATFWCLADRLELSLKVALRNTLFSTIDDILLRIYYLQVIKNIRNVTRHRNGQSVKSRQRRWEWQLLISIRHIHDVVTRYNNCPFLCAWNATITVFFALPPCCVDESYSHVCVPKLYWWMIM